MKLKDIEYLTLRFVRKYLFSHKILSLTESLNPYYASAIGEKDPKEIVDKYIKYLVASADLDFGRSIIIFVSLKNRGENE